MFERFPDKARKVMATANQEAQRLNHEYIGTEHVLLGMMRVDCVASTVIRHLGADYDNIRVAIELLVKRGPDEVAPGKLPQTPRAKKVIEFAIEEARNLNHHNVTTAHLLLGLIREANCIAAQALVNLGLDLGRVREETLTRLTPQTDLEPEEGGKTPAPPEQDPVSSLVSAIVHEAITRRASDIHFDPLPDGGARVRFRIDDDLHERDAIPPEVYAGVVTHLRTVCGALRLGGTPVPEGRFRIHAKDNQYDLRVSFLQALGGEKITARIFCPLLIMISLEQIFHNEENLKTIRRLCELPHGVVVCTGPTGCGKSTLMHALLLSIDRDRASVMSIEDLVDVALPGVVQIPVQPAIGMTFSQALRMVLHHDPDVIMVGEVRDVETIEACLQLSLTGHLVFTTLHGPDAPAAVKSIVDTGVTPYRINSTIAAVIGQRLILRLCESCRKPVDPPGPELLPPEAVPFIRQACNEGVTFYGPAGCDACQGHGYSGRLGIHEILIPDQAFRKAVAAGADIDTLRTAARAAGMTPMLLDGLKLAAKGLTSLDEVIRVAVSPF